MEYVFIAGGIGLVIGFSLGVLVMALLAASYPDDLPESWPVRRWYRGTDPCVHWRERERFRLTRRFVRQVSRGGAVGGFLPGARFAAAVGTGLPPRPSALRRA